MEQHYHFDTISPEVFDNLLGQYPKVVPEKLAELEEQRLRIIPQSVRSRRPEAYFTKDELVTLMDWKLAHGVFRPSLKKLVRQNESDFVRDITQQALQSLGSTDVESSGNEVKHSLDILTKFKGVGPATASLLISVYSPERLPFFSDELFRWAFWSPNEAWSKQIKYNLKEYLALLAKVKEFRERFHTKFGRDIGALDIEKVAFTLGKQVPDKSGPFKANTSKSSTTMKSETAGKRGKATAAASDHDSGEDVIRDKVAQRVTRAKRRRL